MVRYRQSVWLLIVITLLIGAWRGWDYYQAQQFNTALSKADYASAANYATPEGAFAAAYAVQLRGDFRNSIEAYARLRDLPAALAIQRDYNLATLYLKQGIVRLQQGQTEVAWPLLELAKTTLRDVLKQAPAHWAAKYNLERALVFLPDPKQGPPDPPGRPNFSRQALIKTPGHKQLP